MAAPPPAAQPPTNAQSDSRLKTLARGAIVAAGSAIANYVSAPRGFGDGSPLSSLTSADLLRVANTISALPRGDPSDTFHFPELPELVVVGSQSSGKSSLLNAIMGVDILPLGESMVTRRPLKLQLVHKPDATAQMRAEFGSYATGSFQVQRTVVLTAPNPAAPEIQQVRQEIESQTVAVAGPGKNISQDPIHLRILSAYVPDLSLVDLPGLTQMALVEQGQPQDIKDQIRALVLSHISRPRALILAVFPARLDLEADAAIELVKSVDPKGERSIGVLTKVDLMNPGCDISPFLLDDGRVTASLRFDHGYYAVRNRSTTEVHRDGITVDQGLEREQAYFQCHPVYGQLRPHARSRLGVPSLARAMSKELLAAVQAHLPSIVQELSEALHRTEREVLGLGLPLPREEGAKLALVQSITAEFCRDFVGSLSEKRAGVRTGWRIKEAFTRMRVAVHESDAVSKEAYPDDFIADAVKDCEGNHLSLPIPPIEVLEQLVQRTDKQPIQQLLPALRQAADDVRSELVDLCDALCDSPSLARFPPLRRRVREEVVGGLVATAHRETLEKLTELVRMEEAYVASEDATFLQELNNAVRKLVNGTNPALIRDILKSYFQTVQRNLANAAPKAIMLFLVIGVRERLHRALFDRVVRGPVSDLLEEPDDMRVRREQLQSRLERLAKAKAELESCTQPPAPNGVK